MSSPVTAPVEKSGAAPRAQTDAWFRDKLVVVTGAAGYIASNVIDRLLGLGATVMRLSRKSGLPPAAACVDVTGDVADRRTWERILPGADIVFHFAAQTGIYAAEQHPEKDLASNVVPMLHLLECCRRGGWRPDIYFAGTATQAGLTPHLPVDERHRDDPATLYDLHKLMAERYLLHYARGGSVRGATLRLSNVYGPGPQCGDAGRGVLNRMIKSALAGGPLTVYGSGAHVRDYLHVNDVVDAFLCAAANAGRVNAASYFVGSGKGHTIREAAEMIAEQAGRTIGRRVAVEAVPPPQGMHPIEYRNFTANPAEFMNAAGWAPAIGLADGISRTIEAILQSAGRSGADHA